MSPTRTQEPEPRLIGHYAGPVTRLVSYAIDAFLVSALFSIVTASIFWLVDLVTGQNYDASDVGSVLGGILFLVWIFLYFWACCGRAGIQSRPVSLPCWQGFPPPPV